MIGFNRPEMSKGLLDCIRPIRPTKLYFFVDGPRQDRNTDAEATRKVRETVKSIDWPCDLRTNFQKTNLGCGRGVSTAISWFFSHESHGIVLEDDIRPTMGFFRFENELLERYKDDVRVGLISGFNPYGFQSDRRNSYHFTHDAEIWGWGSWARVWKDYTLDLNPYKTLKDQIINQHIHTKRLRKILKGAFDTIFADCQITWDFQFFILLAAKDYLSIMPRRRLTTNVGNGDARAAHLTNPDYDPTVQCSVSDGDLPIIHPTSVELDLSATRKTELRRSGKAAGALTFLGSKFPFLRSYFYAVGNIIERICPALFRISW